MRFLVGLLAVAALAAQDRTASLTGTVRSFGGDGLPHAGLRLQLQYDPWTVTTTEADDVGVYHFSKVEPGKYTLHLAASGFEQLDVKGLWLSVGEQRELPPIELNVSRIADCCDHAYLESARPRAGKGGAIRGTVLHRGLNVANARVDLFCRDGTCNASTSTDTDGAYVFENLKTGDYSVRFEKGGFTPVQLEFRAQERWELDYGLVEIGRKPAVCFCE